MGVLVTLIAASWVLGTVANALAPRLLRDHPLLLVALEPRNRYLLLTAGRVDLIPYLVFATFRRIASDPLYFALGHLYGDRAIGWLADQGGDRSRRFIRWAERVFGRFSHLGVFLFPGIVVCVLAGATGMRVRTFLALNLAGTIVAVVALRVFADQLSEPVTAITEWNDRNAGTLTVATVAIVIAWLAWNRRRGHGEISELRSITELDDDLDEGPRDESI